VDLQAFVRQSEVRRRVSQTAMIGQSEIPALHVYQEPSSGLLSSGRPPPIRGGTWNVSVGFVLNFSNNTDVEAVLTAKVGSWGDWESKTERNPEVAIKGLRARIS